MSRARTVTEVVGEDGSRIGTGAGRSEAAVIVPRKRTDSESTSSIGEVE